MSDQWIKETNELIADREKEKDDLEFKYHSLEDQIIELDEQIKAAYNLIEAYMHKHHIESIPPIIKKSSLVGKSYPEMLIDLAKQNNGKLVLKDATEAFLQANVGSDRKSIAHNITNTIWRYGHFKRIGRGQYLYTNNVESNLASKRARTVSGVKLAVKKLKEQNPLMTLSEITERLIKEGFDFKGKNAKHAVAMSWTVLGYAKLGKQQKLPLNPPQETDERPRIEGLDYPMIHPNDSIAAQ